jgi:hypothetical protein
LDHKARRPNGAVASAQANTREFHDIWLDTDRYSRSRRNTMSRILSWDTEGVELICLCYLEAVTTAQIRYAIRRIRRRILKVSIIVASLGRPMSVPDDEASTAGAEFVQDSLRATMEKILAFALTQSGAKTSAGNARRVDCQAQCRAPIER